MHQERSIQPWEVRPFIRRHHQDGLRLECLRENLCRPFGTRIYFPLYPGLTPWAMIVPPCGLVFSARIAILIPPQFSNSRSHADTIGSFDSWLRSSLCRKTLPSESERTV